jgi:stress-induced morphogen
MPIEPSAVKSLLDAAFPGAKIALDDLTGTRDHYKLVLVTDLFEGKSRVQRQMMINEVLKEPLKGPLHALTMETYTEAQWAEQASNTPASTGIKF